MKNDPAPKQKHSEGKEESTNRHVYVEPGVQIDLVEDLKKTYQTSQTDSTTHNKNQLFWTKVGAGLIFAYALLTFWQGCSTKKAADAARDAATTAGNNLAFAQQQFRMEQRPYLSAAPEPALRSDKAGVTAVMGSNKAFDGFQLSIAVHILNSGKSPAVEVKATTPEYIVGPTREVIDKAAGYIPQYKGLNGMTISAGNSVVPQTELRQITKDQEEQIIKGTWQIAVVGGVQYRDIFSPRIRPYETTYCFNVHTTGMLFADCGFGEGKFGTSIH